MRNSLLLRHLVLDAVDGARPWIWETVDSDNETTVCAPHRTSILSADLFAIWEGAVKVVRLPLRLGPRLRHLTSFRLLSDDC